MKNKINDYFKCFVGGMIFLLGILILFPSISLYLVFFRVITSLIIGFTLVFIGALIYFKTKNKSISH